MSWQITYDSCDPQSSVVVEACAGSGKTWLLVSRMVRLLLAGAQPHEILAITFTRKAAQEMRGRLDDVLLTFATCSDDVLLRELMIRGLGEKEALAAMPQARTLFERVLAHPKGLSVDTFHGWFARLLSGAPLGSGVPQGLKLRDDFKRLQDECLEDWWTALPTPEKVHVRQAYELLITELGSHNAHQLLVGSKGFLGSKAEWFRYQEYAKTHNVSSVTAISDLSAWLSQESPLQALIGSEEGIASLQYLSDHLKYGSKTDQDHAMLIDQALECYRENASLDVIVRVLYPAFLTAKFELLKRLKVSKDLSNYLKKLPESADRLIKMDNYRQAWAEAILNHYSWLADHRAHRIHQAWVLVGEDMLAHYQAKKEILRVQDFSDLEAYTAALMLSSDMAAYLQTRLDAKYKHLLVDEFQDTNPLQWQILLSWLNAYGQDDVHKPTVFLVGDPKQSIYRFRRADVRLFEQAKIYLSKHFSAKVHPFNETRRNSPAVLELVNQVFQLPERPVGYPFTEQKRNPDADNKYGWGEVKLLPLIPVVETEKVSQRHALDLPYIDPENESKQQQSYQEARQVAQFILKMRLEKKANWSDFLILLRSRTPLTQIERAFRDCGIPCDSPRQGGLLKTLEAEDLIALLSVLVTPTDSLALAQVLRSPIYALSDEFLMQLMSEKQSLQMSSLWHLLANEEHAWHHIYKEVAGWAELAKHLPVHDLLDHIYAQSNLRLRYAAAAPPLQRDQVLSNLDAFLSLALDLDGGRYPSLTRFVAELKQIKHGVEEESPDEGDAFWEDAVDDAQLSFQKVRILTIHAAKGLEARFVIVMNANTSKQNKDHVGVLMNWLPEEPGPNHISPFFSGKPKKDPARQGLRDQEDQIADIENWNLLYVAITRAKEAVYISGCANKSHNPIVEDSWYGRLAKVGIGEVKAEDNELLGMAVQAITEPSPMKEASCVADFVVRWQGEPSKKTYFDEELISPEKQWVVDLGVAFHAVMEHVVRLSIKQASDMPSEEALSAWLHIDQDLVGQARACAMNVLRSEQAAPFFFNVDIQSSWEELDIAADDGRLLRVDRLIELPNRLVILDYKLSIPSEDEQLYEKYCLQMSVYRQAVRRLRTDKPVESYLLSANGDVLTLN
jgi:ATP-dependent helicase/nuclease subunit A